MSTLEARQEAARAEIEIGRIRSADWSRDTVAPILARMSLQGLLAIHRSHFLFAGIFTAGRQLADWAWEEIKRRDDAHAASWRGLGVS